ncbi:hypothetical protein [Rhizobium phage RHEph12]|nr:hypothetical protein [Rhizobium phage RHEph12]
MDAKEAREYLAFVDAAGAASEIHTMVLLAYKNGGFYPDNRNVIADHIKKIQALVAQYPKE